MGFERIYVVFLCINLVLMLQGFAVTGGTADQYTELSDLNSNSGSGFIYFLDQMHIFTILIFNFIFGGGVISLLVSSGMPVQLQLLIGIPMFAMAVFGLFSIALTVKQIIKLW